MRNSIACNSHDTNCGHRCAIACNVCYNVAALRAASLQKHVVHFVHISCSLLLQVATLPAQKRRIKDINSLNLFLVAGYHQTL